MEHIDDMEDLKSNVSFQSFAQRDPVKEYQIIAADMFDEMIQGICEDTARGVLSVVLKNQADIKRKAVAKITNAGFDNSGEPIKQTPVKKGVKVGRNDPCPCGSGKKYKKCCGLNEAN